VPLPSLTRALHFGPPQPTTFAAPTLPAQLPWPALHAYLSSLTILSISLPFLFCTAAAARVLGLGIHWLLAACLTSPSFFPGGLAMPLPSSRSGPQRWPLSRQVGWTALLSGRRVWSRTWCNADRWGGGGSRCDACDGVAARTTAKRHCSGPRVRGRGATETW
jgi:hypothetical protein